MKTTILAIVATVLGLSSSVSFAKGADACSLVKPAEIAKVIGNKGNPKTKYGPESSTLPNGDSSCLLNVRGFDFNIIVSPRFDQAGLERGMKNNKNPETVSGVGQGAFFTSDNTGSGLVALVNGKRIYMAMTWSRKDGKPTEAKEWLTEIGKLAASRLH